MQPLLNTRNWILQNHRMTEVWRDLWRSPGLTPAPAGTPRARCSGPGPGSLWRSPRRGLYSLWTACASALSYSQHRSATWYSKGISCFPICTCCLLSCHWKMASGALVLPLFQPPFRYLYELMRSPWACSSPEMSNCCVPHWAYKLQWLSIFSVMLKCQKSSGILQSCPPISLVYQMLHTCFFFFFFCPSLYHDSFKWHFMHSQFLFPNLLITSQKATLTSSLFSGASFTHVLISSEFCDALFTLGWTQTNSNLEAAKYLAKYQLIKVICYNIIQNKSWLTYLLELLLKEIIHKA